ncbi:hypothetical protein [Sporosarcina sp. P20a]|nr:hypothetical protein [Sporosarcina sp. P20a]
MTNKDTSIAKLSAEELHAVNRLEDKIGVTLVAYESVVPTEKR